MATDSCANSAAQTLVRSRHDSVNVIKTEVSDSETKLYWRSSATRTRTEFRVLLLCCCCVGICTSWWNLALFSLAPKMATLFPKPEIITNLKKKNGQKQQFSFYFYYLLFSNDANPHKRFEKVVMLLLFPGVIFVFINSTFFFLHMALVLLLLLFSTCVTVPLWEGQRSTPRRQRRDADAWARRKPAARQTGHRHSEPWESWEWRRWLGPAAPRLRGRPSGGPAARGSAAGSRPTTCRLW